MNYVILALIAFGGGLIISAGLFAIITTIRLINRFAHLTDSKEMITLYEEMIILGAILGNTFFVYDLGFPPSEILGSLYGLFAGMYSGGVMVAIAEVVKALPIFIRRIRISTGLSYVLMALAVGKTIGSLLDAFVFN